MSLFKGHTAVSSRPHQYVADVLVFVNAFLHGEKTSGIETRSLRTGAKKMKIQGGEELLSLQTLQHSYSIETVGLSSLVTQIILQG